MLAALLKQSFTKQKKAMALMIISVAMGTAVSASLITISLDIKSKVSRELRSFGANITLEPKVEGLADLAGQRRYLREQDIPRAKSIFWRHNIVGIAPFLESKLKLAHDGNEREVEGFGTWLRRDLPLPGSEATFEAGVLTVSPWWEVTGALPSVDTVVLGHTLASEQGIITGDNVLINDKYFRVSGTLMTGGPEDRKVFLDLSAMQALRGLPGAVSRVQVSALTTPMDDFAYKDPKKMSTTEYEKWYCTGYVTSIAKQLEEAFKGSSARPIWHVAETEGQVLGRLSVLVYLLTAASLIAAALGMSTTMAASLLRRLDEVALMKALGAGFADITLIFMAEAFIIGLSGGLLGYLASLGIADYIGNVVFGGSLSQRELLLPVALMSAFGIAALGAMLPIRRALRVKSAIVLKEAR
ncbi:ABC transporter permease [Nitrospirota bacterium]